MQYTRLLRLAWQVQGTTAHEELAGEKAELGSKIQKLAILHNASDEEQACRKQHPPHTAVIDTKQIKHDLETSLRQEHVTGQQLHHQLDQMTQKLTAVQHAPTLARRSKRSS